MVQTIFDKAKQEGREETLRQVVLTLLKERWESIPSPILDRINRLPPTELYALIPRINRVASIEELDPGQ